jgi:hypothetical protein
VAHGFLLEVLLNRDQTTLRLKGFLFKLDKKVLDALTVGWHVTLTSFEREFGFFFHKLESLFMDLFYLFDVLKVGFVAVALNFAQFLFDLVTLFLTGLVGFGHSGLKRLFLLL